MGYRLVDIVIYHELDAMLATRAVIRQFDARLHAPEHVRGERDVAVLRVLIRDRADMAVHAEDFLNDDDGRSLAAFGQCQIAAETVVAGGNVGSAGSAGHRALP